MLKITGILLIVAYVPFSAAARVFAQAEASPACSIAELFNPDGWEVPGLSKKANVNTGPATESRRNEVAVDELKPSHTADSITHVTCVAGHPGRIEVRVQPVDLMHIYRYAMNGHVFAYRVWAGLVALRGKKRVGIASVDILIYYDIDGSGMFKVRRYAGEMPFRPMAPEWVKEP